MSTRSLKDWLSEGETLYDQAMLEYQNLQTQLEQLEQQLAAKRVEVSQIALVIGKPPVEPSRRLTAELVEQNGPSSVVGTMTRALTGRGLGRA